MHWIFTKKIWILIVNQFFFTVFFKKIIERSPSSLQSKKISLFFLICTLIYAYAEIGISSVESFFLNVSVFFAFLGLYKYGRKVNSHILFRFVTLSIIIQTIPWLLSLYVTPEWADKRLEIDYLTRFMVFIPLAWWVAQYKNGIWYLYLISSLAILLSPWSRGHGLKEILDGLNGARIDLGLHNAQHTSLYFGVVFLGLLSFIKPLYKRNKFYVIPVFSLAAYCLLIIYLSGSRQSWLALLITAFIFSIHFFKKIFESSRNSMRIVSIVGFCGGIILLASLLLSSEKMVNRVMTEKVALSAIASLDFDNVPYSSFGIRLHSWEAAIAFIKEKPIFGWGGNGHSLVMKHTDWLPQHIRQGFGHLHNTYIEILVDFGVIGLAFYLFMWWYLTKDILFRLKSGEISKEIGYFYFVFLFFWFVMNCFESYLRYSSGVYVLTIVLAGIYGRIWYSKLQSE